MKIEKVEHIGITVKDMDETLKFYTGTLGVKKSDINDMNVPGVMRIVTINTPGASLEFLQFMDPKEPLLKYADPRSEAIHHMAVIVDDIEETLSAIKKQGGTVIHEKPMQMPTGRKIAFALPRNSKVLIEFMED